MESNNLSLKQFNGNHDGIKNIMAERSNYFIRQGTVYNLICQYSSKQDRILEIGSGAGDLAKSLLDNGYQNINLIDIDNYLKEEIKNKVNINLLDISYNPLPFGSNYFDMILAIAIIEHLENPFLIIRECSRTLKKGGKLIIAIPHIFSLRSKWQFLSKGDLMGYNEKNNHISLYTKAIFKKVFLKDYRVIDEIFSQGYIRILRKKIWLKKENKWFDRNFGNKVIYILEKK